MATSKWRTVPTGAILALFLCSPAFALTVYDVIQLSGKNYSGKDIIALIQATESAFELKADDIPRLMKLGVDETVIQAMLKAVPREAGAKPGASRAASQGTATGPAAVASTPAGAQKAVAAPGKPVAGGRFEFEPFREAEAGHHDHSAVNLAGARLLVLRDEGSFSSVAARAAAVVRRLERAASDGQGAFHPEHATGGNSVMFHGQDTHRPLVILKVSRSDAIAYQQRSGRRVTPALLAAYWSDLLSDYWSIAINQKPPTRLSDTHDGEALEALYGQWAASGKTKTVRLADAARLLPRKEQQHLLRLATTVPRDFLIDGSHRAGQP